MQLSISDNVQYKITKINKILLLGCQTSFMDCKMLLISWQFNETYEYSIIYLSTEQHSFMSLIYGPVKQEQFF
jgi:hypothetical protein